MEPQVVATGLRIKLAVDSEVFIITFVQEFEKAGFISQNSWKDNG